MWIIAIFFTYEATKSIIGVRHVVGIEIRKGTINLTEHCLHVRSKQSAILLHGKFVQQQMCDVFSALLPNPAK